MLDIGGETARGAADAVQGPTGELRSGEEASEGVRDQISEAGGTLRRREGEIGRRERKVQDGRERGEEETRRDEERRRQTQERPREATEDVEGREGASYS